MTYVNTCRNKSVFPFVEIQYTEKLRDILKDRNNATLANSFFAEGNQNRATPRVFALREPPVTIIRVYVPKMHDAIYLDEREYQVYAHGRKEDVERLMWMVG